MLNHVWLAMLLVALVTAGLTGNVRGALDGAIKATEIAVTLALGLIGVMSLWLGIMRLAEKSGLVGLIARALRPGLVRLFPDVPPDHPAMGSMVMNIAANLLGLTNAATPLGLRAMRDLETLNRHPGTATNAMCTFLAINTGSVQLIPASAIAVLAASGATQPTAIVGSTLLATCCSSVAALIAVKSLERLSGFRLPTSHVAAGAPGPGAPGLENSGQGSDGSGAAQAGGGSAEPPPVPTWGWVVLGAFLLGSVWLVLLQSFPQWAWRGVEVVPADASAGVRVLNAVSLLAIPFLLTMFPLYAALRRVAVYEEFVEGAKEGFQVAVRIIPFLVAMLVAIGFLRGAGAIELFTDWLRVPLEAVGFPPELLPISLIRPLSGSASLAAFGDVVTTFGPDSLLARTAGTLFGSTETTFYVVAVYFGSVAVRRVRHAVWAGLVADLVGVVAAVVVCRWMFA